MKQKLLIILLLFLLSLVSGCHESPTESEKNGNQKETEKSQTNIGKPISQEEYDIKNAVMADLKENATLSVRGRYIDGFLESDNIIRIIEYGSYDRGRISVSGIFYPPCCSDDPNDTGWRLYERETDLELSRRYPSEHYQFDRYLSYFTPIEKNIHEYRYEEIDESAACLIFDEWKEERITLNQESEKFVYTYNSYVIEADRISGKVRYATIKHNVFWSNIELDKGTAVLKDAGFETIFRRANEVNDDLYTANGSGVYFVESFFAELSS